MFKLITSNNIIVKSYDIIDLFNFIINFEFDQFIFLKNYKPINYKEFCKEFLYETKDVNKYIELESKLREPINLIEYERKKEKV